MKMAILLFSWLSLFGSSDSSYADLQKDPLITSVFNSSEIKELSELLDFFNHEICSVQQFNDDNIAQCYLGYFMLLRRSAESGMIDIKIAFEKQQLSYTTISDNTFHEIWSYEKSWIPHTSDTLKHINYNPEGKYLVFLKKLGEENVRIRYYVDSFIQTGGISPTQIADLVENYSSFNVSDIKLQLFIAVHYLTLNDILERNEKYK